jgi:hypothetical protein
MTMSSFAFGELALVEFKTHDLKGSVQVWECLCVQEDAPSYVHNLRQLVQ